MEFNSLGGSMKAHTQGPWNAKAGNASWGVHNADGMRIASMNTIFTNQEANAALIASAPDLLAALEAILATWEGPRDRAGLRFAKDMVDARAAINKAKGA